MNDFHQAAKAKFERGAQEHGDWDQIDHISEIQDELLDIYNYASKDPSDPRMFELMILSHELWEELQWRDIHTLKDEFPGMNDTM